MPSPLPFLCLTLNRNRGGIPPAFELNNRIVHPLGVTPVVFNAHKLLP